MNGSDVEAEEVNGATALHYAARVGQKIVAEMLVTNGANVNAKTYSGNTPMQWASFSGQDDIVDFLREHGALN
jgi:ankyrin repeat protein